MDENLINENSEKSKFLERLHIFLRIIAIVSLIVGVYLLLTNSGTSSNSISPGMQVLIDNSSYIEIGMSALVSLVLLILAIINWKETKPVAIIYLIVAIAIPLLTWFFTNSLAQPRIVPTPN